MSKARGSQYRFHQDFIVRLTAAGFWLVVLALAAGCSRPAGANPTPIPLQATAVGEPGSGSLSGVINVPLQFGGQPLFVYAAVYSEVEPGHGMYMLDPDRHPHTELAGDGSFALSSVPPGQYVLVVGPTAEEARLVVDAGDEPQVFAVQADQMLEIGEVDLAP